MANNGKKNHHPLFKMNIIAIDIRSEQIKYNDNACKTRRVDSTAFEIQPCAKVYFQGSTSSSVPAVAAAAVAV